MLEWDEFHDAIVSFPKGPMYPTRYNDLLTKTNFNSSLTRLHDAGIWAWFGGLTVALPLAERLSPLMVHRSKRRST